MHVKVWTHLPAGVLRIVLWRSRPGLQLVQLHLRALLEPALRLLLLRRLRLGLARLPVTRALLLRRLVLLRQRLHNRMSAVLRGAVTEAWRCAQCSAMMRCFRADV